MSDSSNVPSPSSSRIEQSVMSRLRMGWMAALLMAAYCELPGHSQIARTQITCDELSPEIVTAAALRQEGSHEEARKLYLATLARARERSCPFQEARVLQGLGVLATTEGRLVDSLGLFHQAQESLSTAASASVAVRDLETSANAARLSMRVEINRGHAYFSLGRLDDAHDALRRALTFLRRNGEKPKYMASALLLSARIQRRRGDLGQANDAVRQALEVLPHGDATTRAALFQERARIEIESGRLDRAEQALDQAVEAVGEVGSETARANLIADFAELAILRRRWAAGLEWANKALDLAAASKTEDLNLEAMIRHLKSVALWKLGDANSSIRVADHGLTLLEARRDVWRDLGLFFFSDRQKYYRHRLDLAAFAERPESAWAVFESYRSQRLLESTRRRKGSSVDAIDQKAWAEIEKRRYELLEAIRDFDHLDPSALQDVIEHQEAVLRVRRLALRTLQAELRQVAGQDPPPSEVGPAQARQMLDSDTLVLVFAGGTEKIHALSLDLRGGLTGVTLETERRTLEERVTTLLSDLDPHISRRRHQDLEQIVGNLSHALLEPLGDRLEGLSRLIVVADGALERLPFELLRHPRTGRRLVESHEISYLPSFSVLAALRERNAKCAPTAGLLALGDPIFSSRDPRWPSTATDPRNADEALALPRLPASATEVERVAAPYGEAASAVVGWEATRERFIAEARKYRAIHVASHARSDAEVPERSKIALSCVDSQGRVPDICDLYLEDVTALDLCGQIVVLSACESAGGQPVEGEGILGLPRAFLQAGAATVVASLWQVADEPTAELMAIFYRCLRQGFEPAAALRQAKLELIEAGQPPSVWSAFVMFGEWRLDISSSTFSTSSGPTERTD